MASSSTHPASNLITNSGLLTWQNTYKSMQPTYLYNSLSVSFTFCFYKIFCIHFVHKVHFHRVRIITLGTHPTRVLSLNHRSTSLEIQLHILIPETRLLYLHITVNPFGSKHISSKSAASSPRLSSESPWTVYPDHLHSCYSQFYASIEWHLVVSASRANRSLLLLLLLCIRSNLAQYENSRSGPMNLYDRSWCIYKPVPVSFEDTMGLNWGLSFTDQWTRSMRFHFHRRIVS